MYVHRRNISDVPSSIYSQLGRLNHGRKMGGTGMYQMLRYARNGNKGDLKPNTRVYWVEDNGVVLSWALIFQWRWRKKPTAYFYTRRSYRGCGYGTKLMKTVNKEKGKVIVHPWSPKSIGFFNKFSKTSVLKHRY